MEVLLIILNNFFILKIETRKEIIKPKKNIGRSIILIVLIFLMTSKKDAPINNGIDIIKENSIATDLLIPNNIPIAIVIPDLETPGYKEKI